MRRQRAKGRASARGPTPLLLTLTIVATLVVAVPAPALAAPTADVVDVSPDPRTTPVDTITIAFSEEVTGIDISDFTLTRDGGAIDISGLAVSGSGATYTVDLSTVSAVDGAYVFTLVADGSGIVDALSEPLAADASDDWTMDGTAPTANIVDVSRDPRTTPVDTITIAFSEDVTGVDISDFTLTRDGNALDISGLAVSGSGATYTVDLSTVSAVDGAYVFTLVADGSGIVDAASNPLTADASDDWTKVTAAIVITESSGSTLVSEDGVTDTYDITLNVRPASPVRVTITVDAQLTTDVAEILFQPPRWDTPQTITVSAIDDALAEGTHTGSIAHTAASGDPGFDGLTGPTVIATILDNEAGNPPIITSNGGGDTATVVVAEGTTAVADVDAIDADGDTLTYSKSGDDAGAFALDTATGLVTFTAAPDFEFPGDANGDNDYQVTITASDGTLSDSQAITVTVTDVNDNAPVVDGGQGWGIAEDAIDGAVVGTVAFSDADATPIATGFTIDSGDPTDAFSISAGGVITVNVPPGLDADTTPTYTLVISVTDGLNPNAPGVEVTITVTNVTDPEPIFTSSATPFIPEGITNVITLAITDPGDASYSITGGVDAGLFDVIDSELVFTAPPDYELPGDADGNNIYDVEVTATTGGGGHASQAVAVTVTDANDRPVAQDAAFSVSETASPGTFVGVVVATDQDAGDDLTYTIVEGGNEFSLSKQGVLSITPGAALVDGAGDAPPYALTVMAEDRAGASDAAAITVQVVNAPPVVCVGGAVTNGCSPPPVDPVTEGSAVAIGTVTYADHPADTFPLAVVDWGDGTGPQPPASFGGGNATFAPHTYLRSGTFSPQVCIQDDDGAVGCASVPVSVINVDPVLFDNTVGATFNIYDAAGSVPTEFEPRQLVVFRGAFYDPGSDSHTLRIDWGDGTSSTTSFPAGAPGLRAWELSHAYARAAPGGASYTATITVTDGDGGTDTLSGPVFVSAVEASVGLVDTVAAEWHLITPVAGGSVVNSFFYGNPGDVPIVGDWNCDGVETAGLFRPSDAFFYLRNSNSTGVADINVFGGNPSDVPLAGDWDGDGCDELGLYRPSTQEVFLFTQNLTPAVTALGTAPISFVFGNPGDAPSVGDWDADGADEIGLYRESTGFFYYRTTLDTGVAADEFFFGDPGDRFIAGDWTGQGFDTPGVFRPSAAACTSGDDTHFNVPCFYLKYSLAQGNADSDFRFGVAAWQPVAGVFGVV